MMKPFYLPVIIAGLFICTYSLASDKEDESLIWTFDKLTSEKLLNQFDILETNGKEKLAKWEILEMENAPSGDKVLALTESKNTKQTYNLAIIKKLTYKDLTIQCDVKAMRGKEDQGGGPIWRAKDKDNYYIARWNPLEDNFRVYYVKEGKRKQIASAEVKVDPKKWHEIRIEMKGNVINAYLNDKHFMKVEDDTFKEAGRVGLWTKADAETAFDDVVVAAQ